MDDADVDRYRPVTRPLSRGVLLNLLALVLILLALGVLAVLLVSIVGRTNVIADLLDRVGAPAPTPTRAQLAAIPTLVPTATRSPAGVGIVPPTNTPPVAQVEASQGVFGTLQPTLTPSITPTFPPATPSRTPTPTPTATPTPGPSATATNTRSPFPFTKDEQSPQYLRNFANTAGCDWMGIGGEVLNVNGAPVAAGQYRVHIWDSGVDQRVPVGGAPAYGDSGYELFLFNLPRIQDHNVQLETVNGTAVSEVYRVQTRASCNENLVHFVFIQNR